MAKKPKNPRAVRRALEREAEKLGRLRERVASLERGGSPSHPIEVASASEVDVVARSKGCARCGGELLLDEHGAETIEGVRLRVVRATCKLCHTPRVMYFRLLGADSLN